MKTAGRIAGAARRAAPLAVQADAAQKTGKCSRFLH
jgi:hypothetical protein